MEPLAAVPDPERATLPAFARLLVIGTGSAILTVSLLLLSAVDEE